MAYPADKVTFSDPQGSDTVASPDHAVLHRSVNDTLEAVQDTLGTTLGTNLAKNFADGQFPVRATGGGAIGTLVQTLVGGTYQNSLMGTNQITGGTITNAVFSGGTISTGAVVAAWPIGAIYLSMVSTNPATLLGFGTWVAFGSGRMLVGFDSADADFGTVRNTGGTKNVTLVTGQIPSHNHTQDAHNHGVTDPGHVHGGVNTVGNYLQTQVPFVANEPASGNVNSNTTGVSVNNNTATNQATGGGSAHTNVPPYYTVYMFERTG